MYDERVSIDHKKIKIVARLPIPKDKTKVRHFRGLATYMKKYVRVFAKIVEMDLLKENFENITWISDFHASIEAMKKAFTKAPILSILDCLKGMSVLCTMPMIWL